MYCNKCGNEVRENQEFCSKCGNRLRYNNRLNRNENPNGSNKNTIYILAIVIGVVIIIALIIAFFAITSSNKVDYYFGTETSSDNTIDNQNATNTKGKYRTAIITDNIYTGITVKSISDANDLIVKDSVNQKDSDYPKDILKIENDIIKKYSVTAVNLKEMDAEYAKELENVIDKIYKDYPKARGYLTNLTLTNLGMSNREVIALFMPVFQFGTSDTSTTMPWVIKTQVQLNAGYFLNTDRIVSAVESSSKSGHFPKNATKTSPVAHELGHYLSFIALLNYYSTDSIRIIQENQEQAFYNIYRDFGKGNFSKKMLDEAHQNYINDYGNIEFDEWRGQISKYALAKDESGNYIYDETIAESFHDVYLNGNNASLPSKYVVEVLKKYIGR